MFKSFTLTRLIQEYINKINICLPAYDRYRSSAIFQAYVHSFFKVILFLYKCMKLLKIKEI